MMLRLVGRLAPLVGRRGPATAAVLRGQRASARMVRKGGLGRTLVLVGRTGGGVHGRGARRRGRAGGRMASERDRGRGLAEVLGVLDRRIMWSRMGDVVRGDPASRGRRARYVATTSLPLGPNSSPRLGLGDARPDGDARREPRRKQVDRPAVREPRYDGEPEIDHGPGAPTP